MSNSPFSDNQIFSTNLTVELITQGLDVSLTQAMTQFTASNLYTGVEHIKVIVKQLRGSSQRGLSNKAAGALTSATVKASKRICDAAAGDSSRLCVRKTKQEGWTHIRTLASGNKLQITRSTGKHTNSILAFLEWAKQHTTNFVKNWPLHIDRVDKLKFFPALHHIPPQELNCHQLEMTRLSHHVVSIFYSKQFSTSTSQLHIADLTLINLNKNYRKKHLVPRFNKWSVVLLCHIYTVSVFSLSIIKTIRFFLCSHVLHLVTEYWLVMLVDFDRDSGDMAALYSSKLTDSCI